MGLTLLGLLALVGCASTSTPTSVASAAAPTPPEPTSSADPIGVRTIHASDLANTGGCGDAFVWAATADDTMGVTIEWQGAATAAWADDGFEESVSLPDEAVEVSLVAGRGLSRIYCNDVLSAEDGETSNVKASSGTVELIVRPDADGMQPASHADVTLNGIVFEVIFGTEEESWHLDELVIEDVAVGWFAG